MLVMRMIKSMRLIAVPMINVCWIDAWEIDRYCNSFCRSVLVFSATNSLNLFAFVK